MVNVLYMVLHFLVFAINKQFLGTNNWDKVGGNYNIILWQAGEPDEEPVF